VNTVAQFVYIQNVGNRFKNKPKIDRTTAFKNKRFFDRTTAFLAASST
jgi:hypothetical protein